MNSLSTRTRHPGERGGEGGEESDAESRRASLDSFAHLLFAKVTVTPPSALSQPHGDALAGPCNQAVTTPSFVHCSSSLWLHSCVTFLKRLCEFLLYVGIDFFAWMLLKIWLYFVYCCASVRSFLKSWFALYVKRDITSPFETALALLCQLRKGTLPYF